MNIATSAAKPPSGRLPRRYASRNKRHGAAGATRNIERPSWEELRDVTFCVCLANLILLRGSNARDKYPSQLLGLS
jgi:hypothetical protein